MRLAWSALFLFVSLIVSGCVGTDEAPATPLPVEDGVVLLDPQTGLETVVRPVPLSFGDGGPYLSEETFEGSYDIYEAGYPLGMVQGMAGMTPPSLQSHDITDQVPKGVPATITVVLESHIVDGDMDVWIQAPNDEIWTSDFDTPRGGRSTVTYTVVHVSDDPIIVHVWYDELERQPSFRYTLAVTVTAEPGLLPGGVPVGVPINAEAVTLELRYDEAPTHVLLWGPDDRLVETTIPNGTVWNHTFESGAKRGDYVLMLPEWSAPARMTIWSRAEAPRPADLVLLRQEYFETDAQRFEANTPVTYTYEADRIPLQTALAVRLDRVTKDAEMSLEGPLGELFRMQMQNQVPFYSLNPHMGPMFYMPTEMGDARHAAGTYTGTFAGAPHGPGSISAWLVYYARS